MNGQEKLHAREGMFVIPADAGIQSCFGHDTPRFKKFWVPAFAGTTLAGQLILWK